MTHRKRMKKSARMLIPTLILLMCIWLVYIITKPKQESEPISDFSNMNDSLVSENTDIDSNETKSSGEVQTLESESQAQLIENDGDIEIIIPEDQDSDGF